MTDSPGDSSAEPGTPDYGFPASGASEPETPAQGNHQPGDHERDPGDAAGYQRGFFEPANHKPGNDEPSGYQPGQYEPASHEPGTHGPGNYEAGNRDAGNHEAGNHDAGTPALGAQGLNPPPAGTPAGDYGVPAGTYGTYRAEIPAGSYPADSYPAGTPAGGYSHEPHEPPGGGYHPQDAPTQGFPPVEGHPHGTPPGSLPGLPPLGSGFPGAPREKRRRKVLGLVIAVAVLAVIGAAAGAYALLHTRGSPQQAAQDYLTAWQQNQLPEMQRVSLGVPAGGLAHPIHQAEADLGVRAKTLQLGTVEKDSASTAHAGFTAHLTLGNGIHWTYQGRLQLVSRNRHWWVAWSDAAIYPLLQSGERFNVAAQWLPRAPVLAADGSRLDSAQAVQESGSVEMITGSVGPLTAAQAKQLGPPYRTGDMAGQGGIEQADERRLAGTPRTFIQLADSHGHVQHTLASFGGKPGSPVKTSIDMNVQQAASRAVASANVGSKPVAMVAIQPSTGDVLAVVDRPGGFDRALLGTYPPGSTFKMVTASALALNGMRPSNSVPCPSTINIGGRTFHNYDYEKLGQTNLLTAFAVSCNTTFAQLGSQQLTGGRLAAMASQFGFGSTPQLGIPAALGHFTTPSDSTGLAADAFGQGDDIVNPLQLATVAGALDNGAWRSPRLVLDPSPSHIPAPHQLDPTVTSTLRPMMAAVVSEGTAAHVGFPPGVYGKTGTAEYGQGSNPATHAWFAGYRGDVAFAVIVEGGGVGADASGPIANAFLRG
jgi:Penicillin binding protein transpeptidase domain/NTF2-like N-terminal transpeptidase domain